MEARTAWAEGQGEPVPEGLEGQDWVTLPFHGGAVRPHSGSRRRREGQEVAPPQGGPPMPPSRLPRVQGRAGVGEMLQRGWATECPASGLLLAAERLAGRAGVRGQVVPQAPITAGG